MRMLQRLRRGSKGESDASPRACVGVSGSRDFGTAAPGPFAVGADVPSYRRPMTSSTMRMTTITPTTPLGP